jgi:hypothetical protein
MFSTENKLSQNGEANIERLEPLTDREVSCRFGRVEALRLSYGDILNKAAKIVL